MVTAAEHARIHRPEFYTPSTPKEWSENMYLPVRYADAEELESNDHESVDYTWVQDSPTYVDDPVAIVDLSHVATGKDSYQQTSTVSRSNFTTLQRDFPDAPWITITYLNVDILALPLGFLAHKDGEELWNRLVHLAEEYPIHDEMHLSELEQDDMWEAWKDFARNDVRSDFLVKAAEEFNTEEDRLWKGITVFLTEQTEEDIPNNGGNDFYTHTGTEVTFEYDDIVKFLMEQLHEFLDTYARDITSEYHRDQLTLV